MVGIISRNQSLQLSDIIEKDWDLPDSAIPYEVKEMREGKKSGEAGEA
jgi:hypothetical protein